jgi:hypothetical protein
MECPMCHYKFGDEGVVNIVKIKNGILNELIDKLKEMIE